MWVCEFVYGCACDRIKCVGADGEGEGAEERTLLLFALAR